jgi:hypothetical protein
VQLIDDDGSPIGSPLHLDPAGHASLATTVGAGIYDLHAEYAGDPRFDPSQGTAVQHVRRAATTTELTSSSPVVPIGGSFVLTMEVTSEDASEWIPDGSIALSVDGEPLGAGPLDADGFAAVEIQAPSTATTGTFTAAYVGTPDFAPSADSVVQTVTAGTPPATPPPTTGQSQTPKRNGAAILPGQSLRTVLKSGLRTRVSCTGPCRFSHRLGISRATARKARLGRVIGKAAGRLRTAGERNVTIRVTRQAKRRLKRARSLRLTLTTTITQRGKRQVFRRRSTLRRTSARPAVRALRWRTPAFGSPQRTPW